MQAKPYAFISYSSKNFDGTNELRNVLQINGIPCWMAPQSIPGGSDYATEIPNAIENCSVFVLVLSKESQESVWVPKELDLAVSCGKHIIPFCLDQSELKQAFNFRLRDVQRIDAFGRLSEAYKELVHDVSHYVSPDAPRAQQPMRPEKHMVAVPEIPCKLLDKGKNRTAEGYCTGKLRLYPTNMVFEPEMGRSVVIENSSVTGCTWNPIMVGKNTITYIFLITWIICAIPCIIMMFAEPGDMVIWLAFIVGVALYFLSLVIIFNRPKVTLTVAETERRGLFSPYHQVVIKAVPKEYRKKLIAYLKNHLSCKMPGV